jgi:hypothetical protein
MNTTPGSVLSAMLTQRAAGAVSQRPGGQTDNHQLALSLLDFLRAAGQHQGAGVMTDGHSLGDYGPLANIGFANTGGPHTDQARAFARLMQMLGDPQPPQQPRNPQVFNDFAYAPHQMRPEADTFNDFAYANPSRRNNQQVFDSMYRTNAQGMVPQSFTG